MPLSLDRRINSGLDLPIDVLTGDIIDGQPPQRALVPVEVIDGTFSVEFLIPDLDFSLDEETSSSPSRKGKYGFYPGVPESLTDEQLTYNPGPAYFIIQGIYDVLGKILRPHPPFGSSS